MVNIKGVSSVFFLQVVLSVEKGIAEHLVWCLNTNLYTVIFGSSLTQCHLPSLFAPVMSCGRVNLLPEEQGIDI